MNNICSSCSGNKLSKLLPPTGSQLKLCSREMVLHNGFSLLRLKKPEEKTIEMQGTRSQA